MRLKEIIAKTTATITVVAVVMFTWWACLDVVGYIGSTALITIAILLALIVQRLESKHEIKNKKSST